MSGAGGSARVFLAGAIGIVLLAIGGGLFVLGSPASVRAKRLDQQRLSDLRTCAMDIAEYFETRSRLPASIGEVGRACEYTPREGSTYELCAVFEYEGELQYDTRWRHVAGRNCFVLDARSRTSVPRPVQR